LLVAAITLALVGLVVYFIANSDLPFLWLPVGLILGGALGNLADRAREGAVVDFIDPIAWPAFNLADAAIVAGVLGLVYVAEVKR
jgi:signal peptidase II